MHDLAALLVVRVRFELTTRQGGALWGLALAPRLTEDLPLLAADAPVVATVEPLLTHPVRPFVGPCGDAALEVVRQPWAVRQPLVRGARVVFRTSDSAVGIPRVSLLADADGVRTQLPSGNLVFADSVGSAFVAAARTGQVKDSATSGPNC